MSGSVFIRDVRIPTPAQSVEPVWKYYTVNDLSKSNCKCLLVVNKQCPLKQMIQIRALVLGKEGVSGHRCVCVRCRVLNQNR